MDIANYLKFVMLVFYIIIFILKIRLFIILRNCVLHHCNYYDLLYYILAIYGGQRMCKYKIYLVIKKYANKTSAETLLICIDLY